MHRSRLLRMVSPLRQRTLWTMSKHRRRFISHPGERTAQQKKSDKPEPFSFADFTWLNGNSRDQRSPARHQVLHA